MDAGMVIGSLVSAVVGLFALYLVIRLAVTHAITATRPRVDSARPMTRPAAYLDSDGL